MPAFEAKDRPRLTDQQFDLCARNQSSPSRDAARMVLVKGDTLAVAASSCGTTSQSTYNTIEKIVKRHEAISLAYGKKRNSQ